MSAELPDLSQSLQGRDLGHLRIIAELWGVTFSAPDARVGLQRLVPLLLERRQVVSLIAGLSGEARAALDDLLVNDGRLPWPLFTRRYGAVREMGPARRDRERPYANPASPAEALWYRGLVARAFFDTPTGPEEFAYLPEDLLVLIPPPEGPVRTALGRPASPVERAHALPAGDHILDHACTLLAALRLGLADDELAVAWDFCPSPGVPYPLAPGPLKTILAAAGLLDPAGLPLPEPLRAFLEAGRGEALLQLFRAWLHSPEFNELLLLPGLVAEGEWRNDPLRARRAILDFLSTVPAGSIWSLSSFVGAVRQTHPDFQRPAGDYDSWYLREGSSGEFLRGFEHWEAVDGALIRYLIAGPLHWLGAVDLFAPDAGAPPAAFRFTPWAAALFNQQPPPGTPAENEGLKAGSDARLRVPRLAPRWVRYQLARFGAWEGTEAGEVYRYRLTPGSLERARQQGLRTAHLLALLRRYAGSVPPPLARALERWEDHGTEARLERVVVLRLSSPDLLQTLRNSRAARFLGDPLGPTAVIVHPGAWQKVLAVLAEMGYLGEAELED